MSLELRFTRRRFLASSTLAALAGLPFLRSLTPQAHAATKPQFLITMFHPFGVHKDEWFPEGKGRQFKLEHKKSSAPLEQIRDDIIVFSNIDNAMGEKNECVHGIDQHHAGVSSLFTGAPILDGEDVGGPSIDSIIAKHLLPNLHHDQVVTNLGVRSTEHGDAFIRWPYQKVDGTTVESQDDPRIAFASLFGPDVERMRLTEPMKPFTGLKEALRDDLLLFEQRLAAPERERFQLYMESFDAFERSLDTELSFENLCKDLPSEPELPEDFDGIRSENIWPIAALQVELAVLALGCGLRRAATLHLTDGFRNYYIPPALLPHQATPNGHGLSHHTDPGGDYLELRTNLNWHHASLFVQLVKAMKDAPSPITGGASLFDESVVLWGSDQSGEGGGGHSKMRVPVTLAAGRTAGFATGRHLDANFGTVSMLLRGLCNAFGMPDQPFGDEEFSPEPLGGLHDDVELAGNYERKVLSYTHLTQRCRTHVQ